LNFLETKQGGKVPRGDYGKKKRKSLRLESGKGKREKITILFAHEKRGK